MGLIVDIPKDGGSGNTNDGNTARRAFSKPSVFAEITGVNENLIYRFAVILQTINSNKKIHIKKYENFVRGNIKRIC